MGKTQSGFPTHLVDWVGEPDLVKHDRQDITSKISWKILWAKYHARYYEQNIMQDITSKASSDCLTARSLFPTTGAANTCKVCIILTFLLKIWMCENLKVGGSHIFPARSSLPGRSSPSLPGSCSPPLFQIIWNENDGSCSPSLFQINLKWKWWQL